MIIALQKFTFFITLCLSPLVCASQTLTASQVNELMQQDAEIMSNGIIEGVAGAELSYVTAKHKDNKPHPALLIVNGRTETWLKYRQLIRRFYYQGFDVFSYDHRGQGLSQRLLSDPKKGYVANFDDYVDDLNLIYEQVIADRLSGPLLVISHSLGGPVVLRYLQNQERYPVNPFHAVVLSAPMIEPETGTSFALACAVARSERWMARITGNQSFYLPGQGPWRPKLFDDNQLTHSRQHFEAFESMETTLPRIRIGGVTADWLAAVCDITPQLQTQTGNISTPLIIIQPGEDTVVSNSAQNIFCRRSNAQNQPVCMDGHPIVIDGAWHEVLFEEPAMRKPALQSIDTFFASQLTKLMSTESSL